MAEPESGGAGEAVVRDDPGAQRFELVADGGVAGYCAYEIENGQYRLVHTEIDSRFEGRGLGSALVRGVLDELRIRGVSVLPLCPFVRGYIGRHREYADLVPVEERPRFGLAAG